MSHRITDISSPWQRSETTTGAHWGSERLSSWPTVTELVSGSIPPHVCVCPTFTQAWREVLKTPLNVLHTPLSPSLPPTPKAQSYLLCTKIMMMGAEQGHGTNYNYYRQQFAFQIWNVLRASLEPCNQFSLSPNFSGNEDLLKKLRHGGGWVSVGKYASAPSKLPPEEKPCQKVAKAGRDRIPREVKFLLCHRTKKTTPRTVDTLSKTGKYWKAGNTLHNTWASVQGTWTPIPPLSMLSCWWVLWQGEGAFPPQGPHKLSRGLWYAHCEKKYNLCFGERAPREPFHEHRLLRSGCPWVEKEGETGGVGVEDPRILNPACGFFYSYLNHRGICTNNYGSWVSF